MMWLLGFPVQGQELGPMILMGPFQLTVFCDSMLKDVSVCCAAPQRYFKIETGKLNPRHGRPSPVAVSASVSSLTLWKWDKPQTPTPQVFGALCCRLLLKGSCSPHAPNLVRSETALTININHFTDFPGCGGGSSHRPCWERATGSHTGTRSSQRNAALGFDCFFLSIVLGCRTVTPAPSAGPCHEGTGADRSCC